MSGLAGAHEARTIAGGTACAAAAREGLHSPGRQEMGSGEMGSRREVGDFEVSAPAAGFGGGSGR